MVASDKTLHDMCVKIPLTKEEMLTANGMGARKLEQYGEAFLYCIRDITNGDRRHTEPRKRTMVLQRFR